MCIRDRLTKAQSVVHISMAESVSPGFANALEASKAFDNVMVIDSGQLSSGMGPVSYTHLGTDFRRSITVVCKKWISGNLDE